MNKDIKIPEFKPYQVIIIGFLVLLLILIVALPLVSVSPLIVIYMCVSKIADLKYDKHVVDKKMELKLKTDLNRIKMEHDLEKRKTDGKRS